MVRVSLPPLLDGRTGGATSARSCDKLSELSALWGPLSMRWVRAGRVVREPPVRLAIGGLTERAR
jgi:hypothetical protein